MEENSCGVSRGSHESTEGLVYFPHAWSHISECEGILGAILHEHFSASFLECIHFGKCGTNHDGGTNFSTEQVNAFTQ